MFIALARDPPPDDPAHPAHLYTNHRLSTDSNASCGAFNSHVKTSTTIPRVSKSGLQDHLFDLQQVQRALRNQHNINLDVTHDHNEHGQPWNDEHRDSLTCRLNQACDRAADKAALAIDERFRPIDPGHGPPATFVTGGIKITNVIETAIAAKQTHNHLALLRGHPKHHGTTARALEQGDVDAAAPESAFKQFTTETKHNTARIRVGRDHCSNMFKLYSKAKTDKNGKMLAAILNMCGPNKSQCPTALTQPPGPA